MAADPNKLKSEDKPEGMDWCSTPRYVAVLVDRKSSKEDEEYSAIKKRIEDSPQFRQNITDDEIRAQNIRRVISPSLFNALIDDDGTYYDYRRYDLPEHTAGQDVIEPVVCNEVFGIHPSTGGKITVYRVNDEFNEFQVLEDTTVSFDDLGRISLVVTLSQSRPAR